MIGRILGGAVIIVVLTSSAAVRAEGPMSPVRPLRQSTNHPEMTAEAAAPIAKPATMTPPAVLEKRTEHQAHRSSARSASPSDNMASQLNRQQLEGGTGFGSSLAPVYPPRSGD